MKDLLPVKVLSKLEVKLECDISDLVYGGQDVKNIVELFNSIHRPQMRINIVSIKKKKTQT